MLAGRAYDSCPGWLEVVTEQQTARLQECPPHADILGRVGVLVSRVDMNETRLRRW